MKNPKIEKHSAKFAERDFTLDTVADSKNFDFFIKMAHYYTVYVDHKYSNLSDEDKINHIYYLLLNATTDYKLTYGDCLLKGLAMDSYYSYIEEQEAEIDDIVNDNYYKSMTSEKNCESVDNHKIDL